MGGLPSLVEIHSSSGGEINFSLNPKILKKYSLVCFDYVMCKLLFYIYRSIWSLLFFNIHKFFTRGVIWADAKGL